MITLDLDIVCGGWLFPFDCHNATIPCITNWPQLNSAACAPVDL